MHQSTTKGEPVITVRQLSKTYRDGLIFRKKFPALKQVSFEVGKGEIFGLLGPNGAGKTTFLKILLGIIRKTSGDATLLGHPAGGRRGRRRVGYLPEQLRIPRHLTAYNALQYYGNLSDVTNSKIRSKQDQLLNFVGLEGRGKDRITKYSKGMLQRLGLAQALLHDPVLLILDEPTDGLDPGARAEMRQLMHDLRDQGATIFLNSHLLQEVEMVCDRVAILNKGNLRYCGPVDQIGSFVRNQPGDNQLSLYLELLGDPTDIKPLLESASGKIVNLESSTERTYCSISMKDQSALDQLVDQLRQKKISIVKVNPESTSLEDAFLQIVASDT